MLGRFSRQVLDAGPGPTNRRAVMRVGFLALWYTLPGGVAVARRGLNRCAEEQVQHARIGLAVASGSHSLKGIPTVPKESRFQTPVTAFATFLPARPLSGLPRVVCINQFVLLPSEG